MNVGGDEEYACLKYTVKPVDLANLEINRGIDEEENRAEKMDDSSSDEDEEDDKKDEMDDEATTKMTSSLDEFNISDDGDYEEEEELALLLEETVFALQPYFIFYGRIHLHQGVAVYAAVSRQTREKVCVKIMVKSSSKLTMLPMEIRALEAIRRSDQGLGKENIQKIHSALESDEVTVCVSKLEKETSFSRKVFGNSDAIRELMRQLLQAIAFLHANQIMHRDIKPSNILWDSENSHLVLCDFDLATWLRDRGHTETLGTDSFMAPEVIAHDRDAAKPPAPYTEKCDVYSAGVVLGGLLFKIREHDLDEKHVSNWKKKIKKKKKNHSPAEDLLLQLLTFEPEKRPSAAEALLHPYFSST